MITYCALFSDIGDVLCCGIHEAPFLPCTVKQKFIDRLHQGIPNGLKHTAKNDQGQRYMTKETQKKKINFGVLDF
jgi:hypothetical protein